MPHESETLIKDIVASVRRVARAMYLDSKRMVKEYGITGPQSTALKSLATKGPLSATELSRIFYVTPSNMTGVIDRLERKGLVVRKRSTKDRRITHIELTGKGAEVAASLPNPIEDKLIHGLGDLNDDEIEQIHEAFMKVVDLIDAQKVEAGPFDPDPRSWSQQQKEDHF